MLSKELQQRIVNASVFDSLVAAVGEVNAEFIVRAVNAHEELVASAKLALKYLNNNCGGMNPKKALLEAIAKAEHY